MQRWLVRKILMMMVMVSAGCASNPERPMDDQRAEAPDDWLERDDWLEEEVLGASPLLRGLRAEPERYRVQIIVSRVVDGAELRTWSYRPDADYFYPASTVKLAAAVASLNELRALSGRHGVELTRDTPMRFHPQFGANSIESADPTNLDSGAITLGHLIRKVFLVSDNEAYNKMFELVGSSGLNELMRRVGPPGEMEGMGGRIVHRLSEARTARENAMLPSIEFLGQDDRVLLALPERIDEPVFADDEDLRGLAGYPAFELGRAYTTGSTRVEEPFVFRGKNRVSLEALHWLAAMVAEPGIDRGRLGLTEDDRAWLLGVMRMLPRESTNPVYDAAEYPDAYQKFFLPGLSRALGAGDVVVAGKLGRAYGFSSDTSHIVHTPSGRSIVLSAVVYTNDNATLNDGVYEYRLADRALAEIAERVGERMLGGEAGDREVGSREVGSREIGSRQSASGTRQSEEREP